VATDFDAPTEADPNSSNHTNDTDEELIETRRSLVDVKGKWLHVEFEENSGCSLVMNDFTSVVRDAVLVGTKRPRTSGFVRGWHHGDEILVNWECVTGNLEGVVKRLDDVGEEWTEGELVDDMGQVHLGVIDVALSRITVAHRCDVEIRSDFLDVDTSVDTAS
jgi:hypothetical protein